MYVREVQGQVVTLRVSGKLWMRSLIMSDVETNTEWSHVLGEAMAGKLKGQTLKPVVSDMLTWGAWRKLHPETTVMNLKRTARKFRDSIYASPDRFVYGFVVGGKAYALPYSDLLREPLQEFEITGTSYVATFNRESTAVRIFERQLGNSTLTFSVDTGFGMQDQQTGSTWDRWTGKAIAGPMKGKTLEQAVGIMSFKQAWKNFHPVSTEIKF